MYFLLKMVDFPASHVSQGVFSIAFWDVVLFEAMLQGGGFKYFFSPRTLGKIPILTSIFFQMGWNHQLDYFGGGKYLTILLMGILATPPKATPQEIRPY